MSDDDSDALDRAAAAVGEAALEQTRAEITLDLLEKEHRAITSRIERQKAALNLANSTLDEQIKKMKETTRAAVLH